MKKRTNRLNSIGSLSANYQVPTAQPELYDFVQTQQIHLQYLNDPVQFTPTQLMLDELLAIGVKYHPYAAYARSLYTTLTGIRFVSQIPGQQGQAMQSAPGAEEAISDTSFEVYPNPATSDINITSSGYGSNRIEIWDVNGRLVYTCVACSEQTSIQTNGWNKGLYSVILKKDSKILNQRMFYLIN